MRGRGETTASQTAWAILGLCAAGEVDSASVDAGVSYLLDTQRDDGGWEITGQKVWTTNAQFASFGMLLARTDSAEVKHKGLTMFIVPMDAKGIDVRPLRQINGDAHRTTDLARRVVHGRAHTRLREWK